MYPDGLIAPVWVRKHAEAIPAVFVSFMRLYEPPPPAGGASPLGHEMIVEAERAAERQADENLVAEISELRKRLAERGVKLTVVLIASAQTLGECCCLLFVSHFYAAPHDHYLSFRVCSAAS